MPTGMTPEQWEETLKKQEKIRKKLKRLSIDLDFCLDGYTMTRKEKFREQADQIKPEMDKLKKNL